jgi:hypothetical protein
VARGVFAATLCTLIQRPVLLQSPFIAGLRVDLSTDGRWRAVSRHCPPPNIGAHPSGDASESLGLIVGCVFQVIEDLTPAHVSPRN